jgi:hypothetical protein
MFLLPYRQPGFPHTDKSCAQQARPNFLRDRAKMHPKCSKDTRRLTLLCPNRALILHYEQ